MRASPESDATHSGGPPTSALDSTLPLERFEMRNVLTPCFRDPYQEFLFQEQIAIERTKYAVKIWLALLLLYWILALSLSVKEFADGQTIRLRPGEPIHVAELLLRLGVGLILFHATMSSWASKRRMDVDRSSGTAESSRSAPASQRADDYSSSGTSSSDEGADLGSGASVASFDSSADSDSDSSSDSDSDSSSMSSPPETPPWSALGNPRWHNRAIRSTSADMREELQGTIERTSLKNTLGQRKSAPTQQQLLRRSFERAQVRAPTRKKGAKRTEYEYDVHGAKGDRTAKAQSWRSTVKAGRGPRKSASDGESDLRTQETKRNSQLSRSGLRYSHESARVAKMAAAPPLGHGAQERTAARIEERAERSFRAARPPAFLIRSSTALFGGVSFKSGLVWKIARWLCSFEIWFSDHALLPLESTRQCVVLATAKAMLFQCAQVLAEISFQRCLQHPKHPSASECGLIPPFTDSPTLLYSPIIVFVDIYFASSAVLFQMLLKEGELFLGTLSLWWVIFALGMLYERIFSFNGAVTYVCLRFLITAFLLFAMRMSEMARRRAFVLGELRFASAELVKQRTRFLARVSHEIRTPLNVMILGQRLMLDTPLNEEQRTILKMAEQSGDVVLAMLRDTLDLAALDEGGLVLMPRRVDIRSLFDISPLYALARSHDLRLRVSISSRCPDSVVVDSTRVSQVVWNLTANALKYTERGRVTVRVDPASISGEILWRGEPSQALLVRVLDTGPGIPEGLADALFDRFRRGIDSSTADSKGGVGLGLSIAKELTLLWDGRIGCCNRTDRRGACFWFTVPVEPGFLEGGHFVGQRDQAAKITLLYSAAAAGTSLRAKLSATDFNDEFASSPAAGTPPSAIAMEQLSRRDDRQLVNLGQHDEARVASRRRQRRQRKARADARLYRAISNLNASPRPSSAPQTVQQQTASLSEVIDDAIIIADDNVGNRRMLELYLRRVSVATLLLAIDGNDAIAQWEANQGRVRLILMDHHMPRVDGVEAVKRIRAVESNLGRKPLSTCNLVFLKPSLSVWRERADVREDRTEVALHEERLARSSVPVLCVTASASARDLSGQYHAAGFDGVLSKPFHRDAIEAALLHFCPELLRGSSVFEVKRSE